MNSRKDLNTKLAALQQNSGTSGGPKYWRCLEELADTESFQELMRQEFPALADVWPDALNRRRFLSLMGASLALAGMSGCSVRPAPEGTIVPYVRPPEEVVPGVPLFFATTMIHGNDAVGVLVESHEGRPTKIEGNPEHPASLGAAGIFQQASVLTMYDPARAKTVLRNNDIRGWEDADAAIEVVLKEQENSGGAGIRLLTEDVNSPTLTAQIEKFLDRYPAAKWHIHTPVDAANATRAAKIAFGEKLDPVYDFTKADVVVSLDADFLTDIPGNLRYARDFMERRRVRTSEADAKTAQMNRLYVVEAAPSCTGVKADHRLAVQMDDVKWLALYLAAELGMSGIQPPAIAHEKWVKEVARDLASHRQRSLVVAGYRQPIEVHLLAHVMNEQLGNIGESVTFIEPVTRRSAEPVSSLSELVADLRQGSVEALFVLGGNPVYTAPAELDFAAALKKVPHTFHLSLFENETTRNCTWLLPESHYLEMWSDAQAFDGTTSLIQPLIAPLYSSRSIHEVMAELIGQRDMPGDRIVRDYWRERWQQSESSSTNGFQTFWQTALHDGVIQGTASKARDVQLKDDWQSQIAKIQTHSTKSSEAAGSLELIFAPDPSIYDGRYALNGWLQELPKPFTKLTWDNAAIISPNTASALGLEYGAFAHGGEHGGYYVPRVRLQLGKRTVDAPVWIMPGHADGSVTVYLGHGRTSAARVEGEWQSTLGFDAYQLRTSDHLWFAKGLKLEKLEGTYPLACTQAHHTMAGRDVVRSTTLERYHTHPREAVEQKQEHELKIVEHVAPPETLYKDFAYDPPTNKWGMAIDITACIGCNACVVACQAENNIPVVGKEQVLFGREMHWIRVDRYVGGDPAQPDEFHFQPVPCMHCEHAPCEYVCPVEATVHSAEGLNDMIYNRCVGTRFCSNNCPYKVRRFNFLEFADFESLPQRLQFNPDVTVRSRGVMEKCTYCVQRIRQAEINAQAGERPLRDGEVLTACQAACPTQAIVFGDMNDSKSAVSQSKESPLNYGLLAELNTYPRTTYLAAVRNPNPELAGQ